MYSFATTLEELFRQGCFNLCCWKPSFSHPQEVCQKDVLHLCVVWLMDMLSWLSGCTQALLEEVWGTESSQGTAVIVTRVARHGFTLKADDKSCSCAHTNRWPVACSKKFPKVQCIKLDSSEKLENCWPSCSFFKWWMKAQMVPDIGPPGASTNAMILWNAEVLNMWVSNELS